MFLAYVVFFFGTFISILSGRSIYQFLLGCLISLSALIFLFLYSRGKEDKSDTVAILHV